MYLRSVGGSDGGEVRAPGGLGDSRGAKMSDVHVTRHFIPFFRNNTENTGDATTLKTDPRFDQVASFCDWVSIYQSHEGVDLPKFNDGAFMRYDANGSHESTTLKKLKIHGSHETGVFIRCDGETVSFEGNVSRFGRPDNVFGYTLHQCISRINTLLETLCLPPFTAGKRFQVRTFNGDRPAYTGARITRLDLTQNFQTGSVENAYAFMRHLSMQQASRLKTGTYGEGETVDFGRGSRRVYSKAYLKHVELMRHVSKPKKPDVKGLLALGYDLEQIHAYSAPFDPYISDLAAWASSIGLVRFETTYKSTFLIDNFHNYLGGLDMRHLEIDFAKRQEVFTRSSVELDDLSSLDKTTLGVYRMWAAGDDITSKLKKSQFYKHRSTLLPYGVDIAVKSNVLNFTPRVKVIQLTPAPMPSFYELQQPNLIRLAA